MKQLIKQLQRLSDGLRRWAGDRRGATAVIVGLMAVPMTVGVGAAIDYTLGSQREDQLNAIADSAALAGETPAMMTQTWATGQTAAQKLFSTQALTVPGVGSVVATVTGQDTSLATGVTRVVTVTYSATSTNVFAALLGVPTLPLGGTVSATQSQAPNINYTLLLDTSPSMALGATPTDISTLEAATPNQDSGSGCAFACHETYPAGENPALKNPANVTCVGASTTSFPPNAQGYGAEDNYALARCLGVTLRIDLVGKATTDLLNPSAANSAPAIAQQNNAIYNFAVDTFDVALTQIAPLSPTQSSSPNPSPTYAQNALTAINNANGGTGLQQLIVYTNNNLTSSNYNQDEDTNWDGAMAALLSGPNALPLPGLGSSAPGDSPQEVLFIVSDGVLDENSSGSRLESPVEEFIQNCTKIKAKGIRIAFLYTTYQPVPTDSWYQGHVASYQAQIGPTYAQGCASAGLYFEVSNGGDISSAMNTLFQKTVTTAHLTQ